MAHKVVIRALGASGELLGWASVEAEARGDGNLWVPGDGLLTIPLDYPSIPTMLSYHWAELNIESRVSVPPPPKPAVSYVLQFAAPLMRLGTPAASLPPVTVRKPVAVTVPTGAVGTSGQTP